MATRTLIGDPDVTVTLKRSNRAKRMSLRVSRLDGRVTLTVPKFASDRDAMGFLVEKESWIRGHLETRAPLKQVTHGAHMPFLGREVEIVAGASGRSPRLEGERLMVPGDAAKAGPRVSAFLKTQARSRLAEASDRYADALGVKATAITLRDTRSRWGSCTSEGRLMYSWRLVMAPEVVLDYVAAHEVAHLLEMNHSARYWAHVKRVCPDYVLHRAWLRRHGETLHAWRFESLD
ncbi:SprT family zinc-dependent metalloprotease [Celeribacter arenosi]|uniref:SprT family zinc-dependent metalloprotease n=1 Tax=Celeribacter arenosi TaxID=792649 RepID=A0ABP7K4B6_9RHOB